MASDSTIDAANAASKVNRSVSIPTEKGASSWNMTLACLDERDIALADRDLGLDDGFESSALLEKGVSSWNMTLAFLYERDVAQADRDVGLDEGFESSALLELSE